MEAGAQGIGMIVTEYSLPVGQNVGIRDRGAVGIASLAAPPREVVSCVQGVGMAWAEDSGRRSSSSSP